MLARDGCDWGKTDSSESITTWADVSRFPASLDMRRITISDSAGGMSPTISRGGDGSCIARAISVAIVSLRWNGCTPVSIR
jgi:hypothetical protein